MAQCNSGISSLSLDLGVISRESLIAVGMWCDDNTPTHTPCLHYAKGSSDSSTGTMWKPKLV